MLANMQIKARFADNDLFVIFLSKKGFRGWEFGVGTIQ